MLFLKTQVQSEITTRINLMRRLLLTSSVLVTLSDTKYIVYTHAPNTQPVDTPNTPTYPRTSNIYELPSEPKTKPAVTTASNTAILQEVTQDSRLVQRLVSPDASVLVVGHVSYVAQHHHEVEWESPGYRDRETAQ